MIRLVIIAISLVACLGAPPMLVQPEMDTRVIGGSPAEIEDFPYQVLVEFTGKPHCGATIISDVYAVTAAHCVHWASAEKFTLRVGSSRSDSGGTVHKVTEVIESDFNTQTADYDIAILKVENPFSFDTKVKPIALAKSTPAAGTPAVVSGWGTTHFGNTTILQKVTVYIVDHEKCNAAYLEDFGGVTERMMCAAVENGGKGACQGDSGGPLVAGSELVGVVSWGKGCAHPDYPGVYTDVAVFRDWIKQHTGV